MSLMRVTKPNILCSGCRSAIIRSSAPLLIANRVNHSNVSISPPEPIPISRRAFTSPSRLWNEQRNEISSEERIETTTMEATTASLEKSLEAPIPWYLQKSYQRPSTPTPDSLLNRQKIPELPELSPPLLEPLLEHISIQLGLDDLDLFDLRHLDPPPALGSKLIMIIGTARSEKHLHVSADRFCRWLRREHGLRANAAGLLGRNELKIKLRRKAKRMKMMANIGATMPEGQNLDDGIRTGWICCTLGRIPAHDQDNHVPGADVENFVGFRNMSTGVNVVVQMFTEEKRAEIDLETLWGGVLKSENRRNKRVDEELGIGEEASDIEAEDAIPTAPSRVSDPFPSAVSSRPGRVPSDPFPPALSSDTSRRLRR